MAEVRVASSPSRERQDRVRPRVSRRGSTGGWDVAAASERLSASPARNASEARRAWNREHIGAVSELLCECALPDCRGTVPAVADTHRGNAERFIVMPAHLDGGVVAKAADRFFVVERGLHVPAQKRMSS